LNIAILNNPGNFFSGIFHYVSPTFAG